MIKNRNAVLITILGSFLIADVLYADVVWPELYLEQRILSFWPITIGLLVEYLFVRRLTGFGVWKSIKADVLMNLASSLIGIVLRPISGVLWEIFPGIIMYRLLNVGTFNPVTWIATCVLAAIVNAIIEGFFLRIVFKTKLAFNNFFWLFLANAISVGIAFESFWIIPSEHDSIITKLF